MCVCVCMSVCLCLWSASVLVPSLVSEREYRATATRNERGPQHQSKFHLPEADTAIGVSISKEEKSCCETLRRCLSLFLSLSVSFSMSFSHSLRLSLPRYEKV